MPYSRYFELAAVSEAHTQLALGPFQPGRLVRGLRVTTARTAGSDSFVALAVAASTDPVPVPVTNALAFDALRPQLVGGVRLYEGDFYVRVPIDVDVYLPLQHRFLSGGWLIVSVVNFAGTSSFEGSVCSVCGLGSVRSSKRRGRTIAVVG